MGEFVGRRQADESAELAFCFAPPAESEVGSSESFACERRTRFSAHSGLEHSDLIGREVGLERRLGEERRLGLHGFPRRGIVVGSWKSRPRAEPEGGCYSDASGGPRKLPRKPRACKRGFCSRLSRGYELEPSGAPGYHDIRKQRPRVSRELGIDENELWRDRTEEIHEPDDFDLTPVGVRLGVVRPERFHG